MTCDAGRKPIDRRLSVAQLAEEWGCSRQHVYNLVERGDLHPIRIGNLIRFRRADVTAYEDRGCHDHAPRPRPSPSFAEDGAGTSSGGRMAAHAGFLAGQKIRQKRERG